MTGTCPQHLETICFVPDNIAVYSFTFLLMVAYAVLGETYVAKLANDSAICHGPR